MPLVDPRSLGVARALRARATEAERSLWAAIRDRRLDGWKFRRQVPIGPWVADFACTEARLVVEVDGGQHDQSANDASRDADLRARGWQTLRFWNNDVLGNRVGVLDRLLEALRAPQASKGPHPSPLPSLRDGRGDTSTRA